MTRDEIKALLDSPELRRIFDDRPADKRRIEPAPATDGRRETAEKPRMSPVPGAARPAPPGNHTSSHKRRILVGVLVGLAPFYVAGLILFAETVREPSSFLEHPGAPGATEAPPARAAAAIIAATPPAPETRGEVGAPPDAADKTTVRPVVAPDPAAPDASAMRLALADALPTAETAEATVDLADRTADRPAGVAAAQDEDAPSGALAESPTAIAAGDRSVLRPELRAGPAMSAPGIDHAKAEAAEEALGLSRSDRREVQRRLRMASSDPQGVDGIFGPATRTAIADWQGRAGLPATGFMDGTAMALLVGQTADEYRAWQTAARARAREREARSVTASSARPSPTAHQSWPGECKRTASGRIAFDGDLGCDFRALGANFKRDWHGLKSNIRSLFD